MVDSTIPVVDLNDFENPARRAAFVRTLGEGLEAFGFVAVVGHGVPPELLARAYGLAAEVFALPLASKRRYETPEDGRQRGYTSFGVEHAKDQPVPDLKEFWHVGRVLPEGHPLTAGRLVPPNRFPHELPAFAPTFTELFDRMEGFANRLLVALGEHLGYPEGFFAELVRDGNSVLRVIHYPDVGAPPVPGAVRSAAHEDINLITVLPASTRPGLELMTRDGTWMPVQTPPDVMVCDTGDMMKLLTGGRMPATTHRVVNPPGRDGGRLSMPYFLHPRHDAVLAPGITAGAFFHQRMREIGVE